MDRFISSIDRSDYARENQKDPAHPISENFLQIGTRHLCMAFGVVDQDPFSGYLL